MGESQRQQPQGAEPTPLTIPVHVAVRAEQVVLSQPEMKRLLRAAGQIAVGDCNCRKMAGNCDRPLEVCLGLDEEARSNVEQSGWREIGVDDALAILERTHRAGLVHLAFRRSDGSVHLVCSCCSCCCEFLDSLTQPAYQEALTASAYAAEFKREKCSECGACISRCSFGAFSREAEGEPVVFDAVRCFGCGLCVSTCPSGAISFAARSPD